MPIFSRWCHALALLSAVQMALLAPTLAADEPDLIFKRSTVFKLLTPNDKLATYGIDDPEVDVERIVAEQEEQGRRTGRASSPPGAGSAVFPAAQDDGRRRSRRTRGQ
jgi:hypothetical protein